MLDRLPISAAILSVFFAFSTLVAGAQQASIALPYTVATIGGLTPMSATAGTQCPNLAAGVTSSDAFGDGCLAVNGVFGVSPYSGLVVDPFGNVLVNDDIKGVLHMINANSGLMTLVGGGNTVCAMSSSGPGKLDSSGDGCIAATETPTTAFVGARGIGIDPYGNILLAGYNDHFVHLICRTASPLCVSGMPSPSVAAPIQIGVGYMGLVAGCAYATGSSGVTGVGTDNTPGFSIGTTSPFYYAGPFRNAGSGSGSCTAALGEVDQPRGATADAYGNVYYADTSSLRWRVVLGPQSYRGVTNPLWAILQQNSSWPTVAAGYVYTVAGITTTATIKGSSCGGGGFATDTHGDGCLFTSASVSTSNTSYAQGVAVDAAGNMIFTDAGSGLLRVLFISGSGAAGAAMANAIEVNNSGMSPATPQPGFVYSLAGGGSTSGVSATPALGNSRTALDTSITKVTISPQGNIFIGDKTRILFFDINTGYIRILFTQSSSNVATGSFCSGSTGPISQSAYGDGCPASLSEFGNSNGLSVAVDGQGDLFLYDGTSSAAGQLVRKVMAQGLVPQALGTVQKQIFQVHLQGATSATSTATLTSSPDISAGSPACTLNGDSTVDCTVAVTSAPSSPGLRSATLTVSNASSGTNVNIGLGETVAGSVLAFDNASTTVNGVTNTLSPVTHSLLNGITPAGVTLDGAGNLYAVSGVSILESISGSTYTLTSSLPAIPSQITIDQTGNIFAVNRTEAAITKLAVATAGTPASYTMASISYTPASGTAAPQAIAVDNAGNLYVADYQPSGSSVYRLSLVANTVRQKVTVASGLINPVALAVDSYGDVFVADMGAGAVYEYSPSGGGLLSYTQSTRLSSITPVALAADAAGDVYVQAGSLILELPASGSITNVFSGLQNPMGLAVDGAGNIYSADASNNSITQVVRNAGSYGSTSTVISSFAGTLTNVGTQVATGIVQTDSSNFTITPSGCAIGTSNSFAPGQACALTVDLSSTAAQNPGASYTDTLSFLALSPTIGSVTFSDMVPAGPTSTSVSGPSAPHYAASGTEATFIVTVTGIAAPSGSPISVMVSSVTTSGTAVVFSSTPLLNSSGQATVDLAGLAPGLYRISATYAGVTNIYASSSASALFTVEQWVATGDSRTVTEPSFPAVCQQLSASLTSVNDDLPASIDAVVTNPDGARIQAALNACSGTGQAVELSVDSAGHNAYLTGPLSMPSNVTLLVDPGVFVYFSRNVQDYDKVAGTHTCGTVNNNSATASCSPLIDIPGSSSNVGIMGFGKLDGRGGDVLINAFPASLAGQSWWGLATIANSGGSQQNPRFIQMDTGSSNITLYKITIRNAPKFHVSTTGAASNFTAWDIKIVTPTNARNTDGIDPGNAHNFTITRSWISDGDDNVAVGAAGTTASAANISVTNNRFFAGHGESIGSYTGAGVSNVLFDSNMLSGNDIAGSGSSINNTVDTNSTGLRIKSGFDRGGVVTNIQYSNSCFQGHKASIVFDPNYEKTAGNLPPNFENILLKNLNFLTAGTVQFTGTNDNGTIYPLQVTLDNVSFPSTFPASAFNPAPTNTSMTYGPGQVPQNFINGFATFIGTNGNTVVNNITEPALVPPACSFTYIAPELTGPNGFPQTITAGQNATAVAILTPAVAGSAYPTGTVTLTDALTNSTTTVPLTGATDTISIPLTGLAVGAHSFTASYSGDANYVPAVSGSPYTTAGPYLITVNSGSLCATGITLAGAPVSVSYGTSFTLTATVTGCNPTGVVQFIVNGSVYATSALISGMATATITLPYATNAYSLDAVYSGNSANGGSVSSISSVTVTPAPTNIILTINPLTTTLGHPVTMTATVTSAVGAPTGTVAFTYTTTGSSTPVATYATLVPASAPNTSVAMAGVNLPLGTDTVTATYGSNGSYSGSVSTTVSVTVTVGTILGLPANPIALPYTMTTLAGGAVSNCSSATDSFGDGCPATAIVFGGALDLRSVVADPFGNVYLTDAVAGAVRRIAPNGVISDFAGRVSGTACVPTATVGCTPTLVSLNKPRGVSSDSQGNIYIAAYNSHQIFVVNASTGLMYLVAGTGGAGSSGDGGPATSAQVNAPRGVWADAVDNIYIADTSNNKIRVVDITGNIRTFAGAGTAASNGDGGLATSAAINNPQSVMTDANLNVYIADSQKVRVVCITCGMASPLDALLAKLGISSPQNGYIYTIAGGGSSAYSVPVLANTINTMSPQKLAIDASSNLYISDGNGVIWFIDSRTGYIRAIAGNVSANCPGATDNFGDSCPASQAVIGNGGNGIGVGTDTLGNIYISDTLNARIRKVTTGLASPSTAVASSAIQPVQLHFIAGDTLAATNALTYTSTEWALGTPGCTFNDDTTTDCMLASSFTPAVPGARSSPLTINSSLGNTANLALIGTGLGAGSTLDPASRISFGSNLSVTGLATDNAGNVYVSDAYSKNLLRFAPSALAQGSSATSTLLATLTAPGAVVIDPRGFVYVADTSTGRITQVSPTGSTAILPLALTGPAGLAVDALNNLYVSDSSAHVVYQYSPITGAVRPLAVGTLVAPAGLAIDPTGNLLITDPGAPAVYRFNLQSGAATTISSTAVAPSAIATDSAGNLLIADTASILAVPASANSAPFTVASLVPSALAIDSAGNLYTGSGGAVLKLTRTQGYVQFAGAAAPQNLSMLASGNQSLQLTSVSQTDTADYNLAATASTDCTINGTLPSALVTGGVCALTATYAPTTFVTTADTVTFNGNSKNAALSTLSSMQLVLTGPTTPPPTTTVINALSPTLPVYGQTVAISVTISGASISPLGTVVFTVDGTPVSGVSVSGGVASATVSGLSAGPHTVSAAYTSSNGFAPSTVNTTFSVSKATLTVTANNASRAVGAANPTFTASYSGFVNGDSASALSGTPSLTTTATTSSPAGLYPITARVGTLTAANYTFNFVNGTLSVVQAPSVSLTTSSTLNGSHSAGYTLTITIKNTGTGPVPNLALTASTLGTTSGSPLPQTWGTVPVGGTATFTVAFPGSAGADGVGVAEKYAGTYTGGTFSTSLRSVTLP